MRAKEMDKISHILCGNKVDLVDEREVSMEEGLQLANSWECGYFEVSVKNKVNVEESVESVVRKVHQEVCSVFKGKNAYDRKKGGCITL
uniref:small monomeric GTPase n=1 Tax=Arcella intermedia TaxID=1963864 RepID=A0A6B2LTZ8_9EUKA